MVVRHKIELLFGVEFPLSKVTSKSRILTKTIQKSEYLLDLAYLIKANAEGNI